MAYINWNETFSVKIDSIDAQHKKLIGMINAFYDSANRADNKEKLIALISEMKEYTHYHFTTEEKYMKQYTFSGYGVHKLEHDQFIAKVLEFENKAKNSKLFLSLEVTSFLKSWILNHILEMDKQYSDFLKNRGIT
jgi:hemerythrin